jgi:hypothetical protein
LCTLPSKLQNRRSIGRPIEYVPIGLKLPLNPCGMFFRTPHCVAISIKLGDSSLQPYTFDRKPQNDGKKDERRHERSEV